MKDYIEILDEKGFSAESIRRIQMFVSNHYNTFEKEEVSIEKRLSDIFRIFGYCYCDDQTVEKIIVNNLNILLKSASDIMKIGYVWNYSGVLDTMNKDGRIRIEQTLRTFLRIIYLENSIKRNASPISYNALLMCDGEFSSDYHGTYGEDNKPFYPDYESLINLYVKKGDNLNEKEEQLNNYLSIKSVRWVLDNIEREKNNARSI